MENFKKDKKGLYLNGKLIADGYLESIKEIYQLENVPAGFCVNSAYEANGYSIVDTNGVQHIYELSPYEFYNNLMKMD